MTMTKNLYYLAHIAPILDEAVNRGEVYYKLPTAGKAFRWRLEAYQFRKLVNDQGITKYNDVVIRWSKGDTGVLLTVRHITGTLYTPEGEIIQPEKKDLDEYDPMMQEALKLRSKLVETTDGTDTK